MSLFTKWDEPLAIAHGVRMNVAWAMHEFTSQFAGRRVHPGPGQLLNFYG